jgi:hypothetical protein
MIRIVGADLVILEKGKTKKGTHTHVLPEQVVLYDDEKECLVEQDPGYLLRRSLMRLSKSHKGKTYSIERYLLTGLDLGHPATEYKTYPVDPRPKQS